MELLHLEAIRDFLARDFSAFDIFMDQKGFAPGEADEVLMNLQAEIDEQTSELEDEA
jgi:hypothetical protein